MPNNNSYRYVWISILLCCLNQSQNWWKRPMIKTIINMTLSSFNFCFGLLYFIFGYKQTFSTWQCMIEWKFDFSFYQVIQPYRFLLAACFHINISCVSPLGCIITNGKILIQFQWSALVFFHINYFHTQFT